MFEKLESRRLFAVNVALDGTVLRITGTGEAENIFVTETAGTFDVGQQIGNDFEPLASVPESLVTRVVLDGQGGDDFLVMQTSGAVGGDVFGGNGNDEVHLEDDGSAISVGHGGNDNDLMVIFAGNGTQAFGDNGSDTLISFEHNHTTYLYGGNAKDDLTGTDKTIMDGGNGKDVITVV